MARLYSLRLRPARPARLVPRPKFNPQPAQELPEAPEPEPVEEPVTPEPEPDTGPLRSLFSLSKVELVALAEERGIDSSGSRPDLIGRLRKAESDG